MNEADTCREYVVPRLRDAGWDTGLSSFTEQHTFTDGRIVVVGEKATRRPRKRADYLLRYRRDFTIAVVEAKAEDLSPGSGMQQAKEYAEILGLKFAYSTNGHGIVEHDYTTGQEREVSSFPTPDELWRRYTASTGLDDAVTQERLLEPYRDVPDKASRYYQEIAINRTVQALLQGKKRVLLTMATGTGKTYVAFQICWKLWQSGWNASGAPRKPKVLYLADRNILIDDPKDRTFTPFGDARHKIENGQVVKSREMYFAIYQSIAQDENRPGLYREFPADFFDLVIVDECHRGSARDDSNWREILDYFSPAFQLGMTATPLRDENRDTYDYFGNPVYQYSLRQGIEDGFLAPYRVHRVVSTYDAAGWRPEAGQKDRYDREIPDKVYGTSDFERTVALRARTKAISKHLADFMAKTDRYAKTILFCVDQEHADEMRRALGNANADLVQQHPNYVCRVTADEGDIGRSHLSDFQDVERQTPAILTTSKLLTTGVDVPTCKIIAIARQVNAMTEFKQIIGRGTRVRDEFGKLHFSILDYTGSATEKFADPEFDGTPTQVTIVDIDDDGDVTGEEVVDGEDTDDGDGEVVTHPVVDDDDTPARRSKYYVDGGQVEIAAHLVYELDAHGNQLRVVKYTDYTADQVRTLDMSADEMREAWADESRRKEIVEALGERGISLDQLLEVTGQADAEPLDVLCHLAFCAPIVTRRERADRVRRDHGAFLGQYGDTARAVLDALLTKYADHDVDQLKLPEVLHVPPISDFGNVPEIIGHFGGGAALRSAVTDLQSLLYAQ